MNRTVCVCECSLFVQQIQFKFLSGRKVPQRYTEHRTHSQALWKRIQRAKYLTSFKFNISPKPNQTVLIWTELNRTECEHKYAHAQVSINRNCDCMSRSCDSNVRSSWTVAVCFCHLSNAITSGLCAYTYIQQHSRSIHSATLCSVNTLYDDRAYFAIFHLVSLAAAPYKFWMYQLFLVFWLPRFFLSLSRTPLSTMLPISHFKRRTKMILSMLLLRLLVVSCLFYSIYYEDERVCLCVR